MRRLLIALRNLWKALRPLLRLNPPKIPPWTIEPDPEQPGQDVLVLQHPREESRSILVALGGYKENGDPYFMIAESLGPDAPRPLRTTLKGSIPEACAVGEEWAAEW